jgi:hypothetical protein
MAREELGHVSKLRKERRRAYHREHDAARASRQSGLAASQIDAAELERRLVGRLEKLESGLAGASAARARELLLETTGMVEEAKGFGRFPSSLAQGDTQDIAETLADAYLEGAETARDPVRLGSLQKLAERAITRLAWLRSLA